MLADIELTRAHLARIVVDIDPTVVTTPAPPPITPSIAFRVAHWWDHSHTFRDTMNWIWTHRPFQSKPPAPPAPPSGAGGSGAGGSGGGRRMVHDWSKLIVGVLGLLGIAFAATMVTKMWSYSYGLEEMQTSDAGQRRMAAEASALATRARAVNIVDILKHCGELAEKYQGQALPSECIGGGSANAAPQIHFNLGTNGTCQNIGTARRGNQMVPIYGSGVSCTSSMSGSMAFFKGNFTVSSGNASVIMKDCTTWDDVEQERSFPQGAKLSGCFRARSDSSTTLTAN